jgi:hypothetical protein
MGTKESSAIKEIFMDSNTINAIKHLGASPIIAVPKEYSFDLPDEIAFVTDFWHFYEKQEIVPLIEFAKLWNSKIVVVYIKRENELTNYQKSARTLLKKNSKGYDLIS